MIGSPLLIAARARGRLQSAIDAVKQGRTPDLRGTADISKLPASADVVITAAEVNELHGTGTLLFRIFPDSSSIVSLRSSNFYDGRQSFGAADFCLPNPRASRSEVYSWTKWYLSGTNVKRIISIPYLPTDPIISLAAKEQFDAPLCTYIMDDKNVCDEGISDQLMEELLAKSDLRLVISPEMRDAYEQKYQMKFWVLPPLVPEKLVRISPLPLPVDSEANRGVLLGNIWGQRWLDLLRECFRSSGFQIDWYCNQKDPGFLDFDRSELEQDGIVLQRPVPEKDLPEVLSRYSFALIPSDTLDGKSPPSVQAIAELSLPSRIPTIVATSHLPLLVLGDPNTCAARFVTRFGLGSVVPYNPDAIEAELKRLLQPDNQLLVRKRSAALSKSLSARGQADWIWRSLALKRACDLTYEELMPALPPACDTTTSLSAPSR